MESARSTIREYPLTSVLVVAVLVFLFMLLISVIVGVSSSELLSNGSVTQTPWKNKSEHMKMPWSGKSEHLFSGDLTPAQQALYAKLSRADPVNSAMVKAEYMNNKQEAPALVSALYS